jgi:PGF-pre-PGF domain-containing protein
VLIAPPASAGASAPIADFGADATPGAFPLLVNFNDLSSNSPTGWAWYFGDEDFSGVWTEIYLSERWSARSRHSSVVLPDGSIVLMGGLGISYDYYNDTWWSIDNGANWTLMNSSAGWPSRHSFSSVVLPDGSIVLMGGVRTGSNYYNDTWRSIDNGANWTLMNSSAGWSARQGHSSVVLPDGSIVLMGGYVGATRFNDVWRSTDNGANWDLITSTPGWLARNGHSSVVLPDGSIVLMGGYSGVYNNDTWRSNDNGANWTLMNSSAGWLSRHSFSSVVLPDGSIVLMGGANGGDYKNDVWRSTDNGSTWTEVNPSAGWTARYFHSSVVLPDGSIVLMGGGTASPKDDVWRLTTAGSSQQNPSHTYTEAGTYQVTLQAYNSEGYNSTIRTDYITVTAPAPVADFTSNVTSGAAPLTVNFTDCSENSPTSWFWDFGDGTNSTDQNPTHTYMDVGAYTVNLTAINSISGNDTLTRTDYITVAIAPVANFTADVTSGAVPLTVNFNDMSTNTTALYWDFGDGNASTDQNPIHTYMDVGTYTVNLTAINNISGNDTLTRTDYITVAIAPVANFTADVTSGAVPLTVNFTDWSENSPTSLVWDFGDGTNSTDQNVTHTYTTAGTFIVNLTATNIGGSNISTQTIITDVVPVANFSADITSGALPLAVNFTDQSTNTTAWYWDFGDGNASALQNPTHTYMDVGTYTVNLTAINAISGNDTLTRTGYIAVAIAPVANFSSNVTSGAVPLSVSFTDESSNDPISWFWDFGDGANSTVQNPTHTYASAGTYAVSLNSTNVAASNTSTQTDYITAAVTPVASFTANVTYGAVPLSVNFTDQSENSPTSWFWDFGDGTNSTDRNVIHIYASTGTFIVNLTATNVGGSNISTQTIVTDVVPVANFSADVTSGALPLAVNFTDMSTNATGWHWDFGDGNASALQNPTYTYMDVGTYTVNLTAINSVSGNDTLTRTDYITVAIAPVANFTASATSGTVPFAVTFTDLSTNSPTAWAWDFGDGATSTDQNATHTYTTAGTYAVSLNASNVGGSNVSTQTSYITVSSASSGSGTRASVSPGQPPEIVKSTHTSIKHVMGGTSVEYDLSGTDSPVLGISFDAKDNEGLVVAKVQVLSSTPEGISTPSGNLYELMSIDVGSQGTISSHNADNIFIRFKVSQEWIRENNIDPSTIRMTRYHDDQWNDLPTYQEREEDDYIYFYAETPGFSIFSVVGDKVKAVQPVSYDLADETPEEPVNEEGKSTPGFTGFMGLLFVAVAFSVSRRSRL